MFVKFALVVIVFGFVALDQLTQCASLNSDKNNDQVNANDVAEVKDLENMLLREIVENAALRYKLRFEQFFYHQYDIKSRISRKTKH